MVAIGSDGNRRRRVTVVEVGPRDGLQNEPVIVPTEAKVAFIEALAAAGLPVVEATSFVSPKAVRQLADADDVMRSIRQRPGVRYPVHVPNERRLDRALAAGVDLLLYARPPVPDGDLIGHVVRQVERGKLPTARIDESIRRLARFRAR